MKTYTYRLRPTKEQEKRLKKCLHLTRKLYNEGLQELIDHYKVNGKHMRNYAHQKMHNTERHPEVPAFVVDETLNRLHRSFANFFRRLKEGHKKPGFPRFKNENRWHSFSTSSSGGMRLRGSNFHAGKKLGGKIRVSLSVDPVGNQKISTVLKRPSGWYLLIVTDFKGEQIAPCDKKIGLDFGITNLIADSDGGFTANPQFLKKSLKKLRIAQRKAARRKSGSTRKRKAYQNVARVHERIHNQRSDYLHKIARRYVNNYGSIYIEDLTIYNMVKNHKVARSIIDSGWSLLRKLLEEKAESAGRQVIAVPPHYTSQKCSKCGEIVQKSLSVRTHICPWCGHTEDRDVNAAKNILRAGTRPSGANVEDAISCVA